MCVAVPETPRYNAGMLLIHQGVIVRLPAVVVLIVGVSVVGCRSTSSDDSAFRPVDDLYPAPIATPAESDPFASPGVLNAPPTAAQPPVEADPVFSVSPTPTATAGGTYQVQKGDTLWSIAQRVYGDGQRMHAIVAANPSITNPDRIREGQVLNLP